MKKALFIPLFFLLSVVIVGIMQVIASIDGILHFFDLHWIFAVFAGLLLLCIPAIGPLAGVYGAVTVWGWSVWGALFLFFWPYFLYGILALFGMTSALWTFRNIRASRPPVIDAEYIVKTHTYKKDE